MALFSSWTANGQVVSFFLCRLLCAVFSIMSPVFNISTMFILLFLVLASQSALAMYANREPLIIDKKVYVRCNILGLCLNDGECYMHFPNISTKFCICKDGFFGQRCQYQNYYIPLVMVPIFFLCGYILLFLSLVGFNLYPRVITYIGGRNNAMVTADESPAAPTGPTRPTVAGSSTDGTADNSASVNTPRSVESMPSTSNASPEPVPGTSKSRPLVGADASTSKAAESNDKKPVSLSLKSIYTPTASLNKMLASAKWSKNGDVGEKVELLKNTSRKSSKDESTESVEPAETITPSDEATSGSIELKSMSSRSVSPTARRLGTDPNSGLESKAVLESSADDGSAKSVRNSSPRSLRLPKNNDKNEAEEKF